MYFSNNFVISINYIFSGRVFNVHINQFVFVFREEVISIVDCVGSLCGLVSSSSTHGMSVIDSETIDFLDSFLSFSLFSDCSRFQEGWWIKLCLRELIGVKQVLQLDPWKSFKSPWKQHILFLSYLCFLLLFWSCCLSSLFWLLYFFFLLFLLSNRLLIYNLRLVQNITSFISYFYLYLL